MLLFLFVSLGPLLVVNLALIFTTQSQLKREAFVRQNLAATQAAERVDNFLGSKIDNLIFESQTSAVRLLDTKDASLNLATYIKGDRDLLDITLANKQGKQLVVVNRSGLIEKHVNIAASDAFRAATFLAGKEYIGPVIYDENRSPHVLIAVPLIKFNQQQDLSHLSTAEFGKYRSQSDITGVLIGNYSLGNLWDSVLSIKIGEQGYAYVVDDKGNLIAHPDDKFRRNNQVVAAVHQVNHFLEGKNDQHQSTSERGQAVLSSSKEISRTKWGVITEEPISSVYKEVSALYRLGISVFIGAAVLVFVLSFLMRKQILTPIQSLSAGADRLGSGDFNYKLPVKTNDELGHLAENFNKMGGNLSLMIGSLKDKNLTLEIEHNKLNSIIKSVSDGIVAIDNNHKIVSINPPAAKLLDRSDTEIMGQQIEHAYQWLHDDKAVQIDYDKPGIYLYNGLVVPSPNKASYVNLVVVILENKTSDVSAIITIRDLTQSRELEVMKVDFVAIAAHELRTPLTFLRGYLELMKNQDAPKLPPDGQERLHRALIGTDQLSTLINNLLNVSRVERGSMEIHMTKVDLPKLVNSLCNQQQSSAKMKNQKLIFSAKEPEITVPADASALSEVINNLLNNAIKYSPDNGQIEINVTRQDDLARVSVKDYGLGIPPEAKSRLFRKFYRVEHSLTTGNRGTGLGLYISKAIIELHHGEIGVESEAGKGSTFYFTLPIYDDAKHAKLVSETNQVMGTRGWLKKDPTN